MKSVLICLLVFLLAPTTAFAHSTVSPSQTATQKYENFSLSVPVEKDIPTVTVRLLIPEGLDRVTPYVKPGWIIETEETEEEEPKVTEITWSGGSIPAGQKDVFEFTARTPSQESELVWKVYQTYSDGTEVAWDRDPKSATDSGEVENPYSVTKVSSTPTSSASPTPASGNSPLNLGFISLVVSGIALFVALRK